ncbi:MAG: ArsR/SmtB family transcription factor [Mycoplasmatales bacterium]
MIVNYNKLSNFFHMFSDASRLKILEHLLNNDEETVTDLAKATDLSISNLSHQLSSLKEMRLVKSRNEGKYKYYSLDDDHINDILEIGIKHLEHIEKDN